MTAIEEIEDQEHDYNYWTTQAMLVFGGGFMQQLARLYQVADSSNRLKIRVTWDLSFYEEQGQRMRLAEEAERGRQAQP